MISEASEASDGVLKPEVVINPAYETKISSQFIHLVPESEDLIDGDFCDTHKIYDRESYFRQLIPLKPLDDALNKHSGVLWAYDYISKYNTNSLKTTDLREIYKLHKAPQRQGGQPPNLSTTFASVDVLCIAKIFRSTSEDGPVAGYNEWLQGLCTEKLNSFLTVNKCHEIFCKFVNFKPPRRLGGVNRLNNYLHILLGSRFPPEFECSVDDSLGGSLGGNSFVSHDSAGSILYINEESDDGDDVAAASDSFDNSKSPLGFKGFGQDPSFSQDPTSVMKSMRPVKTEDGMTCQPPNVTDPQKFVADLVIASQCSQEEEKKEESHNQSPAHESKKQNLTPSPPPPGRPGGAAGGGGSFSLVNRSLFYGSSSGFGGAAAGNPFGFGGGRFGGASTRRRHNFRKNSRLKHSNKKRSYKNKNSNTKKYRKLQSKIKYTIKRRNSRRNNSN